MKKIISILILAISVFSFSKDNYIFDENRIRQVFSEYEILDYEKSPQVWLDILDRKNDLRIQISNYAKGDTIEKARKRINKSVLDSSFVSYIENNTLSNRYFGVKSDSFVKKTNYGERKNEQIFLEKVKFTIEYTGGISDYENALKMMKEAIDPSIPLKNRPKKTFSKNYSIDNCIDKSKLVNNFKKVYQSVKFEDIKGNEMDLSCYKITIDSEDYPRAVWIQANNNYSKKVIDRRNQAYIQSNASQDWDGKDHSYKYKGEEKKIMPKYFGVNAKVYENDYMKRVTKQNIIGIYRYAITDKFTITTVTFEVKGKKQVEQEEYEQFLSIVKSSLK